MSINATNVTSTTTAAAYRGGKDEVHKTVVIPACGWEYNEAPAELGIIVDLKCNRIRVVRLHGCAPEFTRALCTLLADRDVRRLILATQAKGDPFRRAITVRRGMSGCLDYFVRAANDVVGFAPTVYVRKIAHISSAGKFNPELQDETWDITVPDLIHLTAFLGLDEDLAVKSLRKRAQARYVRPCLIREVAKEHALQRLPVIIF